MSNKSINGSISSSSEAAKETVFSHPTRRNSTVTVASSTSTDSVATVGPPPVPVNSPSDTRSVASDVQSLADLMANDTPANNADGDDGSEGNVNMESLAHVLETLMAQMPTHDGATSPIPAGDAHAGAQGEVHAPLPPPAQGAQTIPNKDQTTDLTSSAIMPGGPVRPAYPSVYHKRFPTHGVYEYSYWVEAAEDDVRVGLARLARSAKDEAKSGKHSAEYIYNTRLAVVLHEAEFEFNPALLK